MQGPTGHMGQNEAFGKRTGGGDGRGAHYGQRGGPAEGAYPIPPPRGPGFRQRGASPGRGPRGHWWEQATARPGRTSYCPGGTIRREGPPGARPFFVGPRPSRGSVDSPRGFGRPGAFLRPRASPRFFRWTVSSRGPGPPHHVGGVGPVFCAGRAAREGGGVLLTGPPRHGWVGSGDGLGAAQVRPHENTYTEAGLGARDRWKHARATRVSGHTPRQTKQTWGFRAFEEGQGVALFRHCGPGGFTMGGGPGGCRSDGFGGRALGDRGGGGLFLAPGERNEDRIPREQKAVPALLRTNRESGRKKPKKKGKKNTITKTKHKTELVPRAHAIYRARYLASPSSSKGGMR